jgi:ABC-type glutathione transport system ATPase component
MSTPASGATASSTTPLSSVAAEFVGVSQVYGSSVAVDNIDLQIEQGKLTTLLGPSGCGKTTSLRMLAGYLAPTAGEIRINGVDSTRLPPEKRNLGMVFQSYALFPHMTVADNVAYGLKLRKVAAKERDPRHCRVGSSSASRSRVPSRFARPFFCSTSRCRTSTLACECRCAPRFVASSPKPASPLSWSPTTRTKRSRCRTRWF